MNEVGALSSAVHWCLTKMFGSPEIFWATPNHVHYARWCLRRKRSGECWYLHHFINGDSRPHPHDHPKSFTSIGLWGSYIEEVFDGNVVEVVNKRLVKHTAPWKRTFPPSHVHRIAHVQNSCWTLVRTSMYTTNWGFFVPDPLDREAHFRWVEWERYVEEHGSIRGLQDELIWG